MLIEFGDCTGKGVSQWYDRKPLTGQKSQWINRSVDIGPVCTRIRKLGRGLVCVSHVGIYRPNLYSSQKGRHGFGLTMHQKGRDRSGLV